MGWVSDAIDSIGDAIKAVGDIFSDPLSAIGDIIEGTLNFMTFGTYEFAKDLIGGLFDFEVPYQDRTQMVRAAAGSRQIVYGRARVGGQLVYIESWYKDRQFLTMTIVVAAHQVEEITAVYANGRKVASARSSGNGRMPKHQDGRYNSSGYNRISCWSADGTQSGAILATVFPRGNASNPPNWTSNHKLLGQAYVHIFCNYNDDVFESGLPKFEIELKGKNDIYDPRNGSTGYTDNQALCLLDALRWERMFNAPDSDIDMASFSVAANIADELVASGSGTTERRYTVNGTLPFDRPPLEVMLSLAKAGAGIPIYSQGQWSYSPGAYSAPVMDLDESDLVGGINFQPGPSKKGRHNKATGTYLDASQNFEEVEFSQLLVQAYVDDDLEVLEKTYQFALTNSGTMARRLAKIDIERNRFGLALQIDAKFRTLRLTPGDRVTLSISGLGWDQRIFRVEDVQFSFERGVSLTLREDNPGIYDWSEGDVLELDTPPVIQIPDGIGVSAPTGIQVTEELYRTITQDVPKVRMIVSWDADENRVSRGYDVQIKPQSSSVWVNAVTYWQENIVEINDVESGDFDIRVRAINSVGQRSDWATTTYTVDGFDAALPQAVQLSELKYTPRDPDAVYNTILVDVTPPADADYSHAFVQYRKDGEPGWTDFGVTENDQARIVVNADGAQYAVRVFSVSVQGVRSKDSSIAFITTSNSQDIFDPDVSGYVPAPQVHGLELAGQGNDTEFTGRDAKFEWRMTTVDQWLAIGSEGFVGASGGSLDQYFRDYQVEVWADGRVRRTEFVTDNFYIYSHEKNSEDYSSQIGSNGAWRTFELRVYARGRLNQINDTPARLEVTNPPPGALANLRVDEGFNVLEISYARPDDLDFAGVEIYVSTTQGFTPTEPVAVVSDNSYVVSGLDQGADYYVRLRPFDLFGRIGAAYTSEFAVTTKTGVDLTGLSGWAYEIDPVDRAFIEDNLAGDAIPSEKIEGLAVAKLTAGVINATGPITTESIFRAVDDINNPQYQAGLGPTNIDGTTYLMWGYDEAAPAGEKLRFGVDEVGNAYFRGDISGSNGTFSGDLDAVDGTFTGQLIAATGVLGDPNGNRVEYDGTDFIVQSDNFEIDSNGNASFSGDITGSTITGSLFQTSPSGKRVVISSASNSLKVYDATNTEIVSTGSSADIGGSSNRKTAILGSTSDDTIGVVGKSVDEVGVIGYSDSFRAGVEGFSQGGFGVSGYTYSSSASQSGVRGRSYGVSMGVEGFSSSGIGVNGYSGGNNEPGVRGVNDYNGYGVLGDGTIHDFYADGTGTYGPFTGSHDGLIISGIAPEIGDILISTGEVEKANVGNTISYLTLSNFLSAAAYGVYTKSFDLTDKRPAALNLMPEGDYAALKSTHKRSIVNALGEGQINVCSENGNFEVGDFICTSNIPGKGMRYDGQDMRYVVAKCMEFVDWSAESSNTKMVACIYMCG